jgi:fatty-acyl-CoA synthase
VALPDRSPSANVGGWLSARAALHPGRAALVCEPGGETLSYAELEALANRCAALLADAGVGPGERVAIALPSEPLVLALYFAAAKLGAIFLPLNTRLTRHELAFQLADADVRVLVRGEGSDAPAPPAGRVLSAQELRSALPARAPAPALAPGGEAPQVLMYTSGTTGTPKGALLPHRKTLYNTLNAELYFGLREGDVVVAPIPLFHSFGLKILSVPALFCGATVVLVDRFEPHGLQDVVRRRRATLLGAVPVMWQRMLRAGVERDAFTSLRLAFSAGAALDVETIRAWCALGIPLVQGYGQTETSILCCLDAEHAGSRAGSVGRPVRYGEVRVLDADDKPVAPGVTGEVVVRGPILMLEYWRRPGETAASRPRGWHRTGDLAVVDDEGYVTLVGRSKELYISGGENVYPAEVERVLEEHPDVAEAAVVGVPDPEWGERGRAYVVPARGPLDTDALLAWARERLAGYKLPKEVIVVDELPRTASGKLQKHRLRD